MNMRVVIMRFVFFAGLSILALGLFRTQVIGGEEYRRLSEQNRVRLIPLEAPRGRVFDVRGRLLATNRPAYDVTATPEDVTPEVFPILAHLLNIPESEVRRHMSGQRESPFAPAVIKEDVSMETVLKIEERRAELPGVEIRISSLRFYPYDETASHLIGYIGKISPEEYKNSDRRRYGFNSWVGRYGIEKLYDDKLRGWRGGRQIEVNARGQMIRILSEQQPLSGDDLTVTLDLDFQKEVMEIIRDKHAVVGIMDLKNDGLIALASTPGFNPNVFVEPGQSQERLEFLRDRNAPLLDRGANSAYPPGSVFKLVTALAALEKGIITPETRFFCPGYFRLSPGGRKYNCWYHNGHGSVNLYEAIERSCNVYFYNLGRRLSADSIAKYARELGLGRRLELDVSQMTAGLVPDEAWKNAQLKDKWYQGETLSFAIGQGFLLSSPVQILRLCAIIAKNGEFAEPRLVLNHDPHEGPQKQKIAIREENLKTVRRAMLRVVNAEYGTGQLARLDFTKLAAKTGTAQAPPKQAHAWITGFFPYENPEIAFVIFIEHGGSGGVAAGSIAKKVLEAWQTHVTAFS